MFNIVETPCDAYTISIVLIEWVKHLGQAMLKHVPFKPICPCKILKSAK